ncbi:MAG: serine hydrolase domain-containing protein [Pseudomonadota bacterium]
MPKISYLVVTGVALILAGCKTADPDIQTADPAIVIDSKVDEYFTALTELEKFNGVVFVASDDGLLHRQAYSIRGTGVPSLPVNIESQFDLRSVSKLIAQMAIIDLVDAGQLDPADTLDRFVPDFPYADQITIQHLIDHQSGLPREFTEFDGEAIDLSPEQIVNLAKQERLEFPPGTDTRYSNIGYQLLYYMIADLSGKPFAQHVQESLFQPLGMTGSGGHFFGQNQNLSAYAYGHERDDGQVKPLLDFQAEQLKLGTLYSTIDDLGRLLGALERDPYRSELENESGIISHAGGSDGKRAYIETNTQYGYRFAFLTNYDAIPFSQIVSDVRAIVEGRDYTVPAPINRQSISVPISVLEQYIGTYGFAELEHLQLEFRVVDGALIVVQNGEPAGSLSAETSNIFFEDATSADSFEFKLQADGSYSVFMDWRGATWEGVAIGG